MKHIDKCDWTEVLSIDKIILMIENSMKVRGGYMEKKNKWIKRAF